MADIDRLIQDLKADDGYALNRQRANEAATFIEQVAARLKLLSEYRDMLRAEGGTWDGQLVANDLSLALDGVPDTLCGDYPAPCNCDDPTTHNGH